mmetsp:Transcript_2940/g.6362  ORF Transcript_2940/g.6362 Transcript_2940/m.6362 type:complete len:707 (+) Transcript_2940:105-2225(+)|eukprot:CAMPEP_0172306102 /NCGR_PEP_ID=MMETSP1058-20130122/7239_1 /TAXON_ID=83371 /ORGANISM="Detonula confervacea, Strain CCMP 353" /LENGTH=706 /DNA_ID=CAMNT_0013017883 /DNA_START=100 /DNA_END=2220 /DNA_ORIENTATION=-
MVSSNAVRHRTGGHSPNDNSPSTFLTIKSASGGSNDSANSSGNGKVHGRRRRDELIRSNKFLIVLGGALSVLALCLVGMWASSTSIDGGRTSRRVDQGMAPPTNMKKGRKKRPRGTGYRKEEDSFIIPEIPEKDEVYIRHQHEEVKVQEVSEDKDLPPSDETKPSRSLDSPETKGEKEESDGSNNSNQYKKSNNDEAKPTRREHLPENKVERGESEGSNKSKHKKSDIDDDEDRANDESKEEMSDDEKGKEALPLVRRPVSKVATKERGHGSQPRVLRLQFKRIPDNKKARKGKPELNYKNVLLTNVHRLPTHESQDIASSDRYVSPYPDDDEYIDRVEDVKKSKKYRRTEREALETEECKPKHEWQKGAFPNCNILHEFELGALSGMFGRAAREKLKKVEGDGDELVKYLAHGYWRDVWLVSKTSRSFDTSHDTSSKFDEEITVLKTLRYGHDFTDRNYDRHRKDALASERLSKSPNVVDIFAYCSNSGIFEYGPGGDIDGKLWPYDKEEEKYYVGDISSSEKIDMAYQVARSIADMHDAEDDGFASIAHTDITPSQFIFINGRWKLNDFNRCRFMRLYKEDNSPCGFSVGANPGKFRAPEEYAFEEENEMIDVYSMGNIFYALLSGEMPFEGQKESKAQKKVVDGIRPRIPSKVLESDDIAIRALVAATKKCWAQKPGDRPSAASIRDELKGIMDRIEKENAKR